MYSYLLRCRCSGYWCWWRGQVLTTAEDDDVPAQIEHNVPKSNNTYRNEPFIADIKAIYTTPSTYRYSLLCRSGCCCQWCQCLRVRCPTTKNTHKYYQFIAEINTYSSLYDPCTVLTLLSLLWLFLLWRQRLLTTVEYSHVLGQVDLDGPKTNNTYRDERFISDIGLRTTYSTPSTYRYTYFVVAVKLSRPTDVISSKFAISRHFIKYMCIRSTNCSGVFLSSTRLCLQRDRYLTSLSAKRWYISSARPRSSRASYIDQFSGLIA